MTLVGKKLEKFHPSSLHVTFLLNSPHNCTMRVHAHLKNVDAVVVPAKVATIVNKTDLRLLRPPLPEVMR